MPSNVFDLNNAFVYYLAVIKKTTVDNFLSVLHTDGVQLEDAGVPPIYAPALAANNFQSSLEVLASSNFENGSTAEDEFKVILSKDTKAEFSVSATEGIKLGAKATLMTSIPFLFKSEVELSAEANFSSTQTTSSSTTQTFGINDTIKIPPRSRIKASLAIKSLTYTGTLTAKVRVAGQLRSTAPGANFTITMSKLFREINANPPAKDFVLTDKAGHRFSFTKDDVARFTLPINPPRVFYTATANISANFGASQTVKIDQFKLGSDRLVKTISL
ncbi:MAG TPA: ETX/MTX2 family pore-forming toxin [Thermoanaerobaculia bacterium]|nr:ETX/MTX2 family pore-forming toxin [Thermoanaerobaculia bacterium]